MLRISMMKRLASEKKREKRKKEGEDLSSFSTLVQNVVRDGGRRESQSVNDGRRISVLQ